MLWVPGILLASEWRESCWIQQKVVLVPSGTVRQAQLREYQGFEILGFAESLCWVTSLQWNWGQHSFGYVGMCARNGAGKHCSTGKSKSCAGDKKWSLWPKVEGQNMRSELSILQQTSAKTLLHPHCIAKRQQNKDWGNFTWIFLAGKCWVTFSFIEWFSKIATIH